MSAPPQVKLRGFRIELGEVEAALVDTEGVQLAAAVVLEDPSGTPRLVAYYSPDTVSEPLLVAGLRGRLPAHMVPTQLVGLARMPLLPNEKIDRRALPAPEWGSLVVEEYVAPANELEAQIQAIWQEVLGQERVSTRADFFTVGGNSLQVGCPSMAHSWSLHVLIPLWTENVSLSCLLHGGELHRSPASRTAWARRQPR